MKNLKLLSLWLLCGVLVLAWCEKTNSNENLSCENDDTCPIENITNENPTIEIEDTPSIVINDNDLEWDLNWNGGWFREEEIVFENNEQVNEEPADQPMMRKIVVDENATPEEIENDTTQICESLWWSWIDWTCTLSDGSTIAF